jgi:hypothetical protein
MALTTEMTVSGTALNPLEERRIQRRLDHLGRRLQDWPDPIALLNVEWHADARQAEARLRVRLGHLGPHLISVRTAETADKAVRLAAQGVVRQLEREAASRRGEPTFGVPSRRGAARRISQPAPPRAEEPSEE